MDCSPTLLCSPAPHGVRLAPYPRAARPTAAPHVPAVHELFTVRPHAHDPPYTLLVYAARAHGLNDCPLRTSATLRRHCASPALPSPPAPPTAYTDTATYIPVFDAHVRTRRATASTSWLRRTLTAIFSCCPITCISLCFLLPHSRLPRPLAMSIIHRTYDYVLLWLRETFGLQAR